MDAIPKNRNSLLDFLKGIAVILMIQVHITELFASKEIFNGKAGQISLFLGGAPVAPLFLVIFGFLIASSNKTSKELLRRGVKIFLVGMLLNCCLNLNLILSVTRGIYNIDLLPYIFGVDILQLAGITLIIIALLRNLLFKNIASPIILIIIVLFVCQNLSQSLIENQTLKYIYSFFIGCSTWSYFPLFPWLAYPLAGILFYQLKQKVSFAFLNSIKVKIGIGLAFIIFLSFTYKFAIATSSTLSLYYHHNFIFFGWVIPFLGFYSFSLNEIHKLNKEFMIGKYIRWLGKNVTIIYIIQWLLIGNIATEIYRTVNSPMKLGLYFSIILAVVSVLTFLIFKIKDRLINNQK